MSKSARKNIPRHGLLVTNNGPRQASECKRNAATCYRDMKTAANGNQVISDIVLGEGTSEK